VRHSRLKRLGWIKEFEGIITSFGTENAKCLKFTGDTKVLNIAKGLLEESEPVELSLPENWTVEQLFKLFNHLNLNDLQLRELLSMSSEVAAKMINDSAKNEDNKETHFISTIEAVTALPPPVDGEYAYCAHVEVKMNIDFNEYKADPNKFSENFCKEFAEIAFKNKFKAQQIEIIDAKQGSTKIWLKIKRFFQWLRGVRIVPDNPNQPPDLKWKPEERVVLSRAENEQHGAVCGMKKDEDTGRWMVKVKFDVDNRPSWKKLFGDNVEEFDWDTTNLRTLSRRGKFSITGDTMEFAIW